MKGSVRSPNDGYRVVAFDPMQRDRQNPFFVVYFPSHHVIEKESPAPSRGPRDLEARLCWDDSARHGT
jgi:hypothetical protein